MHIVAGPGKRVVILPIFAVTIHSTAYVRSLTLKFSHRITRETVFFTLTTQSAQFDALDHSFSRHVLSSQHLLS